MRNYSKRDPKEFNAIRAFCQWITVNVVYGFYYKMVCGLKVEGRENVPHDRFFIAASNHTSAIDPFLVAMAVQHPLAYMAKKELFEKPVSRFFMDIFGAFSVNREKLEVSTIKTALGLKKTKWALGIFPQGTRKLDDNLEDIGKGFAGIAKTMKCEVLPVGLVGTSIEERIPFKSKMIIRIGKPIPYCEDPKELAKLWAAQVEELIK